MTKPSLVLNLFRGSILTPLKLLLEAVKDRNITETPFGWTRETHKPPEGHHTVHLVTRSTACLFSGHPDLTSELGPDFVLLIISEQWDQTGQQHHLRTSVAWEWL